MSNRRGSRRNPFLLFHIALSLLLLVFLVVHDVVGNGAGAWAAPSVPHSTAKAKAKEKAPSGIALLIGNGVINGHLRLPEAPAAACLLTRRLKPLGFQVMRLQNPDRATLRRRLAAFVRKARKADFALIHYAGYTATWRGANRLLLADVDLRNKRRFLRSTLPLDGLLAALRKARRAGILLLDGGHALPALRRLKRRLGRRNVRRLGAAMATVRPPPGVAVLLAAPAGKQRPEHGPAVGRLAIIASRVLWNTTEPRPLSALLREMAEKLAQRGGYKSGQLLFSRLAGRRRQDPTWPFVAPKRDADTIIFDWEETERDPEKIFAVCRKLAILNMQHQRAIAACKKVLAMAETRRDVLERYREVEERYPHAPCLEELNKRRMRIKEARHWQRIAKSSSIAALRDFLKRFPKGKHAPEARARLEKLIEERRRRERKAFAAATGEGTWQERIARLEKFLARYPDGEHAMKARRLLKHYRMQERARIAFEKVRHSGDIERLRAFVNDFPESDYVVEARREINRIIAEHARERRLWRRARALDELDAYRRYVSAFPKGAHVAEARQRIEELERIARRKAARSACRTRFGGDFVDLIGDERDGFICLVRGVVGMRLIPLKAKQFADWFFIQRPSGLCEIWTYPLDAQGAGHKDKEPEVSFWRRKETSGSSMGFDLTSSSLWDADSTITLEADGNTYELSRWKWWMKPRRTGGNSVSDEVTKALAAAERFSISGQAADGGFMRLTFSALGFQKSFHTMAQECGMAILTWIDDWSAVARSGSSFYWNTGHSTRKEAIRNILRYCRRESDGECRILTTFRNRCFALYRALSGGWSWAVRKTVEEAKEAAYDECKSLHEGCYLAITTCADGSNNYSNKNPPVPTLTWKFSSTASYSVSVQFYSASRNAYWPGYNTGWVIDDYDTHTYRLSCRWGEKICYGAWPTGNPTGSYWGCGFNCRQWCADCCYDCKGQTVGPINLRD